MMETEESMLDKWDRVFGDVQKVEEFLDWLTKEKLFICNLYEADEEGGDRWIPTMSMHTDLVNKFFGIEPNQLEKERRELLESIKN